MSSISQCQNNIQRYKALKAKINLIISKLSLANHNADDLNNDIRSKYQVNDSDTPIATRVQNLKNNVEKTSSFLSNKVLPAIDIEIANLNKQIAQLEAEQRMRNKSLKVGD